MISKEEREELAKLIGQSAVFPLPWEAHGDGYSDDLVFSANEAQEEHIAEFTGRHSCDLAVAAVNAAPKLLAALDAADKRIAELEAAAQSAIFALQPNWVIDHASVSATLGQAVAAHQTLLQALADGCRYVARETDGYYGPIADALVALGLLVVTGTDDDGEPKYKRVCP